jgi:hypothetical protein
MVPPVAYRAMAIVHLAMFDAVNSIEPTYQSVTAATAAGTVLDCGRGSGRVAPAKDMGTMTVHF